jgi:transcription initiation factor TFIIIB Brf1 subunit/transcription initiation factor TFIIB
MEFESSKEVKDILKQRRNEKIAVKATYIFLAIATLYFAGHLAYYFIAIKPNAEVPNIDGVMIRNEAQMYGGYREL